MLLTYLGKSINTNPALLSLNSSWLEFSLWVLQLSPYVSTTIQYVMYHIHTFQTFVATELACSPKCTVADMNIYVEYFGSQKN
jgi:hypothetical protein